MITARDITPKPTKPTHVALELEYAEAAILMSRAQVWYGRLGSGVGQGIVKALANVGIVPDKTINQGNV
jgi:hypothetical protein